MSWNEIIKNHKTYEIMMVFHKPTLYLRKLKKLNPTFLDIQGPQKIQKKIWTYKNL